MIGRRTVAALAALLAVAARPADAHLVSTGMGPFYDGLSHLLVSPADLLAALALALLAGLGGARHGRMVLFLLPAAWLAGGLVGLRATAEVSSPVATTLPLLVLGALVAAGRRLPAWLVTALAGLVGLGLGGLNGSAVALGGVGAVIGIATAVFVLVALASAAVVSLHVQWARIVVRVAGSWIAAIGLLMLGWTFRSGG